MNKKIIPVSAPVIGKKELQYATDAIKKGWISKGEYIDRLEKNFSKYHACKYGISTMNGTAALHLALAVLGITRGDEIIVPDLTFFATAEAVSYCNAIPIPIDVTKDYWCMDPMKIEEKLTDKTRAIIPVHIYGHPCDMDLIMEIAQDNNLYVIEDCAEAHGAEYKGKKIGSIGDISCFSFYGNKVITTGEGGMCITNNKKWAEEMEHYRSHCMTKQYYHDCIGFNYRMTNIQAAIGVAQLEKIDAFIEKKRMIAKMYTEMLKETGVGLPVEMPWAKNIYWMYSILVKKRDKLMKKLEKRGIETRPFFTPMHMLPSYRTKDSFPNATDLYKRGMNLPSGISLTKKEIGYICREIQNR